MLSVDALFGTTPTFAALAGAALPNTEPSESRMNAACDEFTMPSASALACRFWLDPRVSSFSLSDEAVRPRFCSVDCSPLIV